ncbi:MAG: phosphate ABC transporter substrate-binding protein [Spirochaetes bacterium]|nr:phosphate ABC transporter substrate-binding protein [Spirochaetota bacterium]
MKRTIPAILVILAFAIVLSGCKKETLTITGSETMYPMLKILEDDFKLYNDDVQLVVRGGGSKTGLKNLVSGRTDIAASSLEIEEDMAIQLASIDRFEVAILAYDGIAVVVNRNNPVMRLHLRQISDMFAGRIRNWKDVGGFSAPVIPVVRNDYSGTAAYMKRHVLRQYDLGELIYEKNREQKYAPYARVAKNNREIAEIVASNINAISYMGMGSADTEGRGKVKKIQYALTARGPYFFPEPNTVVNRQYMLSRPLMLVYRKNDPKKDVFLSYLKSQRASKKIRSSGYLDIMQSQIMLRTLTVK